MYSRKYEFVFIAEIIVGIALIALSAMDFIDQWYNGFGAAVMAVGAVRLLRSARIRKNPQLAEKIKISQTDERNRFLSDKARGIAFYYYIVTAAILAVIFQAAGQRMIGLTLCYSICGLVTIYWIAYYLIRNKY